MRCKFISYVYDLNKPPNLTLGGSFRSYSIVKKGIALKENRIQRRRISNIAPRYWEENTQEIANIPLES